MTTVATSPAAAAVDAVDWAAVRTELDELPGADVLDHFRSTVDMARHCVGLGRVRSFAHPLPAAVG